MVTAWLVGGLGGQMEYMEEFGDVEGAVASLRDHWNEDDDGPQTFVVTGDTGIVRAILMRLSGCFPVDGELCRTVYDDGRVETHRCRYVLDGDGMYDRTEITDLTQRLAS